MKIKFTSPYVRIKGERKSKLLDPKSELYIFLRKIKNMLNQNTKIKNIISEDRMDLHIELLNKIEDPDNIKLQNDRIKQILKFDIDVKNNKSWGFINQAFCLFIPQIDKYNAIPHITIIYLKDYNITPDLLNYIRTSVIRFIHTL